MPLNFSDCLLGQVSIGSDVSQVNRAKPNGMVSSRFSSRKEYLFSVRLLVYWIIVEL